MTTGIVLNMNNSAGITLFDVPRDVRKVTQLRKIDHAGALKPFAANMLHSFIWRGETLRFCELMTLDKGYEATFGFGQAEGYT